MAVMTRHGRHCSPQDRPSRFVIDARWHTSQ
jgi:hypothetical protein